MTSIKITDANGNVFVGVQPLVFSTPDPPPPAAGVWQADFFGGTALSGPVIYSTTYAGAGLDLNWGAGSPNPIVPVDNFSARFTQVMVLTDGAWEFHVRSDDGFRLKIDGTDLFAGAGWMDQSAASKEYVQHITLPGGAHTFVVEYYEHGGLAELHLSMNPYAPPPVPPPSAPGQPAIGVHILTSIKGQQQAASAGAKAIMFMNRPDEACDWATGDPTKWSPGCGYGLSIYRIYHDSNAWSPADMVSQLAGLTENPRANKFNVIITLANEWDNGISGASNSADGMSRFCDWSIDCINRLKAKGFNNVAWLTSSMGTPDFTQQSICDVIKQKIAPWWNMGAIRWTDMHLYSPTKDWIYKSVNLAAASTQFRSVARVIVGRDFHEATYEVPSLWPGSLAAFNDMPTYQSWYERRWEFLYTRCGFDPNAPGRIVSSEAGLDEDGIGGFPAHQMDRAAVNAYCTRWLQLQAQPLVVNGVNYPSPFMAGTLFQGDPDDPKWAGYRINGYLPLIWSLA